MKNFLWFFSIVLSLQCVTSQISIVESGPGPGTVKPTETLQLTCKVTGASLTDSSKIYSVEWIRQPEGKGLEWLGRVLYQDDKYYAQSLQGRLTLTRDTKKGEVYLKLTGMKPEESGKYYCARSRSYYAFDIWGQGTMILVTSATQQAPSLFPLISCGTSLDPTVSVGCLARDFLPEKIDFSWNDKSNNSFTNGLKTYKPVLQSTGTYVATSQVKVTSDSWNKRDPYYCVAKHSLNTKSVRLVKEEEEGKTSRPVVTMNAPVKDDLYMNGNSTVVCVMRDFYPKDIKVTWRKDYVETTLNIMTDNAKEDASGKFMLSSYITVTKQDWDKDTVYSCVVEHSESGFHEMRNLSKSQICEVPADSGVIQVAVEPPSFESMYFNKNVLLTCIISNMQTGDGLEVSWHELGSETKLDTTLGDRVYQNSVYSIKATATVCADDWLEKKFECRVKHPDLTSPKKVILMKDKSQAPQPPTVFLFPPHQDELNSKESVTLTCVAKGYYPKDIFVRWTSNDQIEDRNVVVTTESMEEPYSSGKKSFFLYSRLTLPSIEDWTSGKSYTCMVGHEALPLQATQRSIDKTTVHILYIEEDDDIDNLWTTASTFIVLFLLSLFYSATVTVFKVK